MMNAATRQWYVVRTKPGASREAKARLTSPVWRKEENEAERELRDAGFYCYFPRMRKEIKHHRTKKWIVRAFPLFTGYVFVDMVSGRMNFEAMRDMRFIGAALGYGSEGGVLPIPSKAVEIFIEAEKNMEFDDTREARQKRKEEGKNLKETLEMQFPARSRIKVKHAIDNDHPFSGFFGDVVSVSGRGKVQAMIELFGGLVPCEFDAKDLERLD